LPPSGHKSHLRVFIDPDLQRDEVWVAAGTWHGVFGIEPRELVEASEDLVADLLRS
jgi:prolyl-tRNA editing enzyme YbaK/EbsC (Cys-tRNA(Pro) deacylase)